MRTLTKTDVEKIKRAKRAGVDAMSLAKTFGVGVKHIYGICRGESWPTECEALTVTPRAKRSNGLGSIRPARRRWALYINNKYVACFDTFEQAEEFARNRGGK